MSHFSRQIFATLVLVAPLTAQQMLKATKEVSINSTAYNMSSIDGISVSPSGMVAIAQRADGWLLFFDKNGKPAGKTGRKGEGPWEYRLISYNGFIGDTLWVYDPMLKRLTWIGPGGKGLRTDPLPTKLLTPQGGSTEETLSDHYFLAPTGHGTILATTYPVPGAASQPWYPIVKGETRNQGWLEFTVGGKLAARPKASESTADGKFCQWNAPGGAKFGSFGLPLCASPVWGASKDGKVLVHLTEIGETGYRIVVLNGATGDTLGSRRVTVKPRPVSPAKLDSLKTPPKGFNAEFAAAYRNLSIPKNYPSVGQLIVGSDGSVWVEEGTNPDKLRRWHLFTSKAQESGILELPRTVFLAAAGPGFFWAVARDADDDDNAVRYKVSRSDG